jgi:hypothetical protein
MSKNLYFYKNRKNSTLLSVINSNILQHNATSTSLIMQLSRKGNAQSLFRILKVTVHDNNSYNFLNVC